MDSIKLTNLKYKAFNFFVEPSSSLYKNFINAENTIFSLTQFENEPKKIHQFSPFIPAHQDAAARIWVLFETIMHDSKGLDGLERVLDKLMQLKNTENPDLLSYAFMVFITHHPVAKILPIPPLEIRNPTKVAPSPRMDTKVNELLPSDPYENVLKWYREDPLLNEHHEHWHIVYPIWGLNPNSNLIPNQDRRGELFFYMHRQMVARYDCERVSVGLQRVLAFDIFSEDIDVAVEPNRYLRGEFENFNLPFAGREPNRNIRNITWPGDPLFGIEEMEKRKVRLNEIINTSSILLRTIKQDSFSKITGLDFQNSFDIFKVLDKNGYIRGRRSGSDEIWSDLGYITEEFEKLPNWEFLVLPEEYSKYREDIYNILKENIRNEFFPLTLENLNLFASLIEVNAFSLEGSNRSWKNYYGNHHGSGHNLPAQINSDDKINNGGLMSDTTVAVRDPYFFRWHKHIDEFYLRWQEKLDPYDFNIDCPQVIIRSGGTNYTPDIILCLKKDFPGCEFENFNGFVEGRYAFGNLLNARDDFNNPWETDFTNKRLSFYLGDLGIRKEIATTDTLYTYMDRRTITYRFKDNSEDLVIKEIKEDIEYLNHYGFIYFIRLENKELWSKKVTIRIFIVPLAYEEKREMWIEMDKFVDELKPKEKKVIYRSDNQSSIIRKPSIEDPSKTDLTWQGYNKPDPVNRIDGSDIQNQYYCDCGWPYSLLLPRGTREGQAFKLFVMVTDWEFDRVGDDECCGSMSYCGARDRYPDKRAMGYPFDRSFRQKVSIANTIASAPNMASRIINIQWIEK